MKRKKKNKKEFFFVVYIIYIFNFENFSCGCYCTLFRRLAIQKNINFNAFSGVRANYRVRNKQHKFASKRYGSIELKRDQSSIERSLTLWHQ